MNAREEPCAPLDTEEYFELQVTQGGVSFAKGRIADFSFFCSAKLRLHSQYNLRNVNCHPTKVVVVSFICQGVAVAFMDARRNRKWQKGLIMI